jgi:hypothetical protein
MVAHRGSRICPLPLAVRDDNPVVNVDNEASMTPRLPELLNFPTSELPE